MQKIPNSNPSNTTQKDIEEAQYQEVLRREQLLKEGKTKLIPWDEVKKKHLDEHED